jgi:threonine dehydratase
VAIRTVADEQTKEAVLHILREMKLLVEPSGAVAAAAWLSGALDELASSAETQGDIVLLLSGGNMDPALLAEWKT